MEILGEMRDRIKETEVRTRETELQNETELTEKTFLLKNGDIIVVC